MRIQFPKNFCERWPTIACSWGFALILCGQMVAWSVRGYTPFAKSIVFPAVPMLAGMALLVRPGWLYRAPPSAGTIFIIVPILLMFFPYAAMSLIDPTMNKEAVAYMTCLCFLTFFVALNRREDFSDLPLAVLVVGGIGCIVPIVEFVSSPIAALGRMAVTGNGNPLAVAGNGAITFCAAIVVGSWCGRNSIVTGVISALAVFLAVANVLLSGTRSTMLALPICLGLYLLLLVFSARHQVPARPSRKRNFSFLLTLALLGAMTPMIITSLIDERLLDGAMKFMQSRADTILHISDSGPLDDSASLHRALMDYNWNNLTFWGHGLNAQSEHQGEGVYAHNVYLQAFYDLGLAGGLLLLVVAIVLPTALIVLRWFDKGLGPIESLIVMLFVNSGFDQMLHGTPYTWTLWPATLLIYVVFSPGKQKIQPA